MNKMKKFPLSVVAAVFLIVAVSNSLSFAQDTKREDAKFDAIVAAYKTTANEIIAAARKDNDSYLKLQELCDDIGHRLSGSESLEKAIEWAQESLKKDGHENVQAEKVTIRKWVRGNESCELILPRPLKINMLGSVSYTHLTLPTIYSV